MSDVEVVATYERYNINRASKGSFTGSFRANLNIEIKDRFGQPVVPRVVLGSIVLIGEVVNRITDGTIEEYDYSIEEAKLVPRRDRGRLEPPRRGVGRQ